MKGSLDRTKVVLRHLPHNISQSALMEQIDARFSGRYNWFCFRSGKNSLKCQSYSRAYIDFKHPDDVIEFAEFFDGHVFVNEKGTQFKTIVEYAPSQRVPKQWSKKDGREGTIDKDPEYLEFLELISKPVENLPSAEIQLERKEAERAGNAKEAPIVTPLMDFIRQKRAAKGGSRRSLPNGKLMRRPSGASSSSSTSNSPALKRGSERRRTSTTMYVPRDTGKGRSGKEKSTYVQVHKPNDQQPVSGSVVLEEGRGSAGTPDIGKKKILLLKGKEKEIPLISSGVSSVKISHGCGAPKQREGSGRVIRSILINKDSQQNLNREIDRKPPRPPPPYNGLQDDMEKRGTRNKDRPDRGVWTPLRHSDDDSLSSSLSQSKPDSSEGTHGEGKYDMRGGSGRGGHFSPDNDKYAGSHKHVAMVLMRNRSGFRSQALVLSLVSKLSSEIGFFTVLGVGSINVIDCIQESFVFLLGSKKRWLSKEGFFLWDPVNG
ncbi:unnamed protein product [Lactuca saligna]|uniref:UPF3 domain-containing protein n=1 Tax=Lactuca saligna TaxID=75948 RepID=A0AA35ZM64_LACSI|nr:unnamed protein product [Lactuca saligna]